MPAKSRAPCFQLRRPSTVALAVSQSLPPAFWLFAGACGVATAGLVTFGVISYHLTRVLPVAAVPLIYAAAMAAAELAALVSGWLFDRHGRRVLLSLPILVAVAPRSDRCQFGALTY
jgi:MFS family permease